MALVKETLKNAIKTAFLDQLSKNDNTNEAINDLADKLATAIDNYIKSATITNIHVLTSPSGPVTGTITSTIN